MQKSNGSISSMFFLSRDAWEVKNSQKKGKGVFAKKDIPGGLVIGDYLGKIVRMEDDDVNSTEHFYAMYYSDEALILPIDAQKDGLHLLNHSCAPNCWMYTFKGHTLFFTLRHIFPGEELTVSYLLSPQDEECKPCTHLCECNAPICFHTMHLSKKSYDTWEKFHEKQEKATKPEKVTFGQDLQRLSSYPKSIPDDPIYILFGSRAVPPEEINDAVIPPVTQIRKVIRENGRTLQFVNLHVRVLGVLENLIISEHI